MHPDLKVGLALAMLIVGFAGAMCFRHRPMDAAALNDPLPSDEQLDAEMELLPVRTYTPEPEESESNEELIAPELLSTANGQLEIPEPIATAQDVDSDADPSADATATADSTSTATTTYVVRSGDTLSGIASRLLGSTHRYEEIFEANRHQLNSPDDLKLGMVLVIPPKDPVVGTEPAAANEEPTPATVQRFTPIVPR
jgi:LysM repeat protein